MSAASHGLRLGAAATTKAADHAAHRIMASIEAIRAEYGTGLSLRALTRELTARGIQTPGTETRQRDARKHSRPLPIASVWTATTVKRVLARI